MYILQLIIYKIDVPVLAIAWYVATFFITLFAIFALTDH